MYEKCVKWRKDQPERHHCIFVVTYRTSLEVVYTFCKFLVVFLWVNNQTSQKTCIKLYLL